MDNLNYIYLLQEREFVKCNENIYKVGKTKKDQFTRFNQYPNGSILLLQIKCNDCDCNEREIIKLFKSKYTHKKQIGHEYFEGDYEDMMKNIFNIVLKNNGKKGSYCVNDVEDDVDDDVVDDVVDDIVVKVAKPVVVKVAKPVARKVDKPVAVKAKTPKAYASKVVEDVVEKPIIITNENVRVYTHKASKVKNKDDIDIIIKNPFNKIQCVRNDFGCFLQQQYLNYKISHPEATFIPNKFIYDNWDKLTSKQKNEYKVLAIADEARYQIDIGGKSSSKQKKDLTIYLNILTVKKLKILARILNICCSGNKDNIINNFINSDYKKYYIENIIQSYDNYKYLIWCLGEERTSDSFQIRNESHYFFSNKRYCSYQGNNRKLFNCSMCKCKTLIHCYDNELYY